MKELIVSFNAFGSDIIIGTLADNGHDVLFQYSSEAIAQGYQSTSKTTARKAVVGLIDRVEVLN